MPVTQFSRIRTRRGPLSDLPKGTPENPVGLLSGEFGLATDTGQLFIGTPDLLEVEYRKPGKVADGLAENEYGQTRSGRFPYGNTQILTEWSRNAEEMIKYVYRYRDTLANTDFPGPGSGIDFTYDQARPWNENNEVISRTLQERLDEIVSVKSYGATGDGVTDDTYAIWRAAIDVVRIDPVQYKDDTIQKTTSRRILYFPAGTYKISRPIILPPYATWIGDGIGKTIIKLIASGTDFKNKCVLETVDDGYCSIDGLEELQACWSASSNESHKQELTRTEYQIGNATTTTSGIVGAELPVNICVMNMTLKHGGHVTDAAKAKDVVRLNRASTTKWYNVRFEGSNFYKTDYYIYDYARYISDIFVTFQGNDYKQGFTHVKIPAPQAGGIKATATATVSNGKVTKIDITNNGQGYPSDVTVSVESDEYLAADSTLKIGSGADIKAHVCQSIYECIVSDNTGRAMYNDGNADPLDTNSIAVFIDGLGGLNDGTIVNPTDHIFIGCQFANTTYGFSLTDQVKHVLIEGCTFENHYRAISIGENMWWYTAEVNDVVTALPMEGLLDDLGKRIGMDLIVGGVYRIKLKTTDKIYKVITTTVNTVPKYTLTEIKSWGLHTNGDDGDRTIAGKYNGPSDIKISHSYFRNIIESAIFVEKGANIVSDTNSYDYTVSRGEKFDNTLSTAFKPIIYFSSKANHCASIMDSFNRNNSEVNEKLNTQRILYNPLHTHAVFGPQEGASLAEYGTKILTTSLGQIGKRLTVPDGAYPTNKQLGEEFKNTGIELPINQDDPNNFNHEGYIINYTLTNTTIKVIGELYIVSKYDSITSSIVNIQDYKKVMLLNNDPKIVFVGKISKRDGKDYISILYHNPDASVNMNYTIKCLNLS